MGIKQLLAACLSAMLLGLPGLAQAEEAELDFSAPPQIILSAPEAQAAASIDDPLKDYAGELDIARTLGALLGVKGVVSAAGTEMLIKRTDMEDDRRLRGYVTSYVKGDTWRLSYIGETEKGLHVLYSVDVSRGTALRASVEVYEDGAPMSQAIAGMWAARQRGLTALKRPCSQNYNTAVIPYTDGTNGQPGYLVYLTAVPMKENQFLMGGHIRAHVNADGSAVTHVRNFLPVCAALDIEPGKRPDFLIAVSLDSPYPEEIHVFMSLINRVVIALGTRVNDLLWIIGGTKISVMEKSGEANSAALEARAIAASLSLPGGAFELAPSSLSDVSMTLWHSAP